MSTPNPTPEPSAVPDPAPGSTAGLEPGNGVSPGDTPPGEGSMSGASPGVREHVPNQGPVVPNRTPMIITLVVLALLVLSVLGYGVAQIATYAG